MRYTEFGVYIKTLRERAGIIRTELCKQISITRCYYSRIEIHNEVPSPEVLAKIADSLKIKRDMLFGAAIEAKCDRYRQRQLAVYSSNRNF